MESYKKILISYPQFSDWYLAVTWFDYFQVYEYIQIFEYICEYLLQVIFLLIFVTQSVKNKIHICICIIIHYTLNWSCDLRVNERPQKKLHPMA